MSRFLPYLPGRWMKAAMALVALVVFAQVLDILVHPPNYVFWQVPFLLMVRAVFAYLVVFVVYVLVRLVKRD